MTTEPCEYLMIDRHVSGLCVIVLFGLSSPAFAYKVQRVCEEKTTRAGTKTVCRTVLVRPDGEARRPEPEKGEAGKSGEAGKHH